MMGESTQNCIGKIKFGDLMPSVCVVLNARNLPAGQSRANVTSRSEAKSMSQQKAIMY